MKTDLSYLLSMSDGDMEIINEMIEIFTSQVKEISAEMVMLEKNGNYDALSKLAHKAKSSVAIMGMNSLSLQLKDFEILTQNGKMVNTYKGFINGFIKDTEEAVVELEQFIETHKKINHD